MSKGSQYRKTAGKYMTLSKTKASIPKVSKMVMAESAESIYWKSVRLNLQCDRT